MTNVQKLSLRLSEIRTRLNAISGEETLTPELRTEMETLSTEYADTETRWRAATIGEGDGDGDGDGESVELRALIQKVELREYLAEAATGRAAQGAEHELRAAIFGDAARQGLVPWEVLLPTTEDREVEKRVDAVTSAPTDVGASQADVLGRVFANTSAAYLGVSMPMVPVGEANFPVLSTGATGTQAAKDAAQDAEAATFTTTVLEPRRLTARYLFAVEDAARLRGMEDALRADLAGALGEAMDSQVIAGDGVAPNVSGFLTKLAAPTNATTTLPTFAIFAGAVAGGVDGRYAANLREVRSLVGAETYGFAASLFVNDPAALADYLIARSGGFVASALIPDPVASGATEGTQEAIIFRERGLGSAVAPVWAGFELLRDPWTNAAQGQVSITAVALWNFAILRDAAYGRLRFKVVA